MAACELGGGSGGNGAWTSGQVGGGGGGGAGSNYLTAAASDVQVAVDGSGTPSVTISYTPDTTPPQIDIGVPAGAEESPTRWGRGPWRSTPASIQPA